jgi:molecular chaperone GrpE
MARRGKKMTSMNEETQEQNEIQDQDVQQEDIQKEAPELENPKDEGAEDFEAKYNEMNDKFLRLYSEFDNFRKRTAKERIDLLTNSKGEAMKSLIPVVDDFDRAIQNNEWVEDPNTLRDAFNLIHHKFVNLLKHEGITAMETNVGDDFDTDKHEAVTQIPAPEPALKGKIVDVIEKGYTLNDKVLRYAKVVTGS